MYKDCYILKLLRAPYYVQMALDEAFLLYRRVNIFRFYRWKKPTISYGYLQKIQPQFINRIINLHLDYVRRPTGGRAVLHSDKELTYAFIGKDLNKSTKQLYNLLAIPFFYTFKELGLDVSLSGKVARRLNYDFCFTVSSWRELEINSKKIVGSAQLRKKGYFLQHGSILLDIEYDIYKKVFLLEKNDIDKTLTSFFNEGIQFSLDRFLRVFYKNLNRHLCNKINKIDLDFFLKEYNFKKLLFTLIKKYKTKQWNLERLK